MIQEFRISVTPVSQIGDIKGEGDKYLVQTELSAPGVPLAQEMVEWPVERWLGMARELLNDPLLNWLEGKDGNTNLPTTSGMVELGQELYNGLFQGTMRDSWMIAQGIAQHRRKVLQLRLGLKGKRLPSLPWEILHAGDRPLATGTDVIFSRYQPGTVFIQPVRKLELGQPLRILMAISAPTDQANLELKQEGLQLQKELESRSINSNGQQLSIELNIIEQPDREQLTQALEQGKYQVFHYAGHSGLGSAGGELYLVSSKTGLSERLSGDDLAGLLVNNGIQMAVLNSCRGAYGGTSDLTSDLSSNDNLAEALVRRGIPSVLAMAERIPDRVSLTLTRLFYRNLIQVYPVDLSLSRARQGLISAYGSHQLYWALPVLYLHPEFDGHLLKNITNNQEKLHQDILPIGENQPLFPTSQLSSWDNNDDSLLDEDFDDLEFVETLELTENQDKIIDISQVDMTKNNNNLINIKSDKIVSKKDKVAIPLPPPIPHHRKQHLRKFWAKLLPGLGAVSLVGSMVFGSFYYWQYRQSQPSDLLPTINLPVTTPDMTPINVKIKEWGTAKVTSIAISSFQQGDLIAGAEAIAALLETNRSALQQAKVALAEVPPELENEPTINFLKGRLAWQFVQQGNKNYSVSDARLFWYKAVQGHPELPSYRNALAFAYYAEGRWEEARQVWLDLIEAGEDQNKKLSEYNLEITTAYAGLAIVMQKLALGQPPAKRQDLLQRAIGLRQIVLESDALSFQPSNLAKDWLWTESAIRDWRSVLKLPEQNL